MDVIDLSRPQTQKILVLQSVQFRVAGNSWGYGCSVLYRALFFKWISIFITVGGYLQWGFVFSCIGQFYYLCGLLVLPWGVKFLCTPGA
jgi:hypothetical protein